MQVLYVLIVNGFMIMSGVDYMTEAELIKAQEIGRASCRERVSLAV